MRNHVSFANAFMITTMFTVLCVFSSPVLAHDGFHGAGFGAGFAHPLTGLDHLLAMLAVGIWAVQLRRSALWVLPTVFPAMMVIGAWLAVVGVRFPAVEGGIAASVLVLGLLVAFAARLPLWAAASMVSLFALLHGHAHGSELPAQTSAWLYAVGFVLATGMLHALGLTISLAAGKGWAQNALRLVGGGVAAAGLLMVARLT